MKKILGLFGVVIIAVLIVFFTIVTNTPDPAHFENGDLSISELSVPPRVMRSPRPNTYEYESEIDANTETYDAIRENIFHDALKTPLSTFSIDVDAASYAM